MANDNPKVCLTFDGAGVSVLSDDLNDRLRACRHRVVGRDDEVEGPFTVAAVVGQKARGRALDLHPGGFASHRGGEHGPVCITVVGVGGSDFGVIVGIHANRGLAKRERAPLELWNGQIEGFGVFGFLRRVVGNGSSDFPAILVRRGALRHLNGGKDDFRFLLVNVDRSFAERYSERGGRSATGPAIFGDGEVDRLVGLTCVLNFDAIVNFLLAVPILTSVGFADDEVDAKDGAARTIGCSRGHDIGFGFGNLGSGRSNDSRDGGGDGGVAGGVGFHCLSNADVHDSLFVAAAVNLAWDLGYGRGKAIAVFGGFL